ncbi:hypothetical protein [Viridibacillus arvi]|uniref:hypothetical protein n=1 Tax=Viridibacillus arvi TaxID=263475 RepID=UPI0034CD6163
MSEVIFILLFISMPIFFVAIYTIKKITMSPEKKIQAYSNSVAGFLIFAIAMTTMFYIN